eukprot:GDKJ01039509.1.p1 GENE.GDKJ01039509.1~~GDKJ01039509.1.p1  ORF type:complete len:308 (-),score=67.00 GDKJ01039509.1:67-954(-)
MSKQTMHPILKEALAVLRADKNFDAKAWIHRKVDALNAYMSKCGLKSAVVSVSGGIDSSVTIGLVMEAMRQPNSPIKRVLGIAQPIHSTASIQNRAFEVCEAVGAEYITVDQSEIHNQLSALVHKSIGIEGKAFANGQLRSYMRTPVNYYVAQLLSQEGLPCIVMGTGNMDEDGYLFYFCKAGDGVSDVQLIGDLHKSEVFKVGYALNLPNSVLVAPPSADLWDGQTDEDELGFLYDHVELYTALMKMEETEVKKNILSIIHSDPEAKAEFETKALMIDNVHRRNSHKMNCPLNL